MDEDDFECSACGYQGPTDEGEAGDIGDTAGVTQCPKCGELDWGD